MQTEDQTTRLAHHHRLLLSTLQLATRLFALDPRQHRPSVRQDDLSTVDPSLEYHLLATAFLLPSYPHLRDQLVPRQDRRREPRLETLQPRRVGLAERLEHPVRDNVPRAQTV